MRKVAWYSIEEYWLPWTPFCLSSGDAGLVDLFLAPDNEREDLAGDVALQSSDRVELGMPFRDAPGHVGLGFRVGSKAPDGDDVQRAVGRAIAPAVQPMRIVLPDEAGTGLTPQSAAKLASDRRRSGLSPAVRRSWAAQV